ncbi:MAG: hypothetical protein GXO15_04035 [Crenarchaeota archaeon]|nr:hypothetical protein [Thermoproteota archaeon]
MTSGEGEAGGGERRRRPLFATGEVVGDYEPLLRYWEKAGEKAGDSVLRNEDFQELQRLVREEQVSRLDEVLERLKPRFRERVDAKAASEALTEYYGVEVSPEEARDRIAELLAGWLVEAASQWNIIRLRRRWERGEGADEA